MNCLAGHLKKIRMEAANEGMPRCYFCGNVLIQDDSQMCADVNVDYKGDEEAMVTPIVLSAAEVMKLLTRQRKNVRNITMNTGTKTAKIWQTIIKEGQQPRAFLGNSGAKR